MLEKSRYYNNISSAAIILIFAVLYCVNTGIISMSWYSASSVGAPSLATPLSALLLEFEHSRPILSHIVAVGLIIMGGVAMLYSTIKHNLYGRTTHLPLMLYLALFAVLSPSEGYVATAVASLAVALSIRNLYSSYGNLELSHMLFSALFYLGLVPLIYPASITLLPLVLVSLLLFERSGREIFVVFGALLTPLFFQLYALWLCGDSFASQLDLLRSVLMLREHPLLDSVGEIIAVSLSLPIALYVGSRIDEISITLMSRKRTLYTIFIYMLTLLMLFFPSFAPQMLLVAAAPISIFTVTALVAMPQRWAPTLYLLYLLAILLLPLFVRG